MINLHHQILYDVENKEHKDFIIDIYINNNLVNSTVHKLSKKNQLIDFHYSYDTQTTSKHLIKLIIHGHEQKYKSLNLKKILINNLIIDHNKGFYKPENNVFWESLSPEDKKTMKKKVISHGGIFGWFGSVEFEYYVTTKKNRKKLLSNLFPVTEIMV